MSSKYLIINADDAGLSPEVDAGILETIRSGAVTSVSLFVNPPFRTDLEPFIVSGVSIGLHLNLVLGTPCSSLPALPFNGLINSVLPPATKGETWQQKSLETLCLHDVKEEFQSQLRRFRELTGKDPTHLDVHKHLHRASFDLFLIVAEMAKDLNLPLRCLDNVMRAACKSAGVRTADFFIGDVYPSPYWTVERLREQLTGLPDGITELMCHPAADMKAMTGLRYVKERDGEREALTSRGIKELLAPFQLVNFRTASF